MADNKQFGSSRLHRFGDPVQAGDTLACARCEAMLADAIDGILSAEDQQIFESHMDLCSPCAQVYADARRGTAWLDMLREPRPEPPAALLERILAQTSNAQTSSANPANTQTFDIAAHANPHPAHALPLPLAPAAVPAGVRQPGHSANVLPFRTRSMRSSAFGQILLQPRLAMTAAMAFFSIVLTLDLTGVRLRDLRASVLQPSSLQRDFYSANARVVQYYEGLRVVYELESRVHDLETNDGSDATAGSLVTTPQSAEPGSEDDSAPESSPASKSPAAQPPANHPNPATQPKQRPPAPNSGTSRRENLIPKSQLFFAYNPHEQSNDLPAPTMYEKGPMV